MNPKLRFASVTVAAASVLLAATVSLAADVTGEWLVDPKSGCRVWNGFPEAGESVSWDGPCDGGYAHGEGTLQWFLDGEPNGGYEGERQNGKANGYGINSWTNGDRYEGYWQEDLPHGFGTYTWTNGSGYQGDWVEGKKHGNAKYIWPNGDSFEGTYKNDRPFGGVYIEANGKRYLAQIHGNSIGPGQRVFTAEERAAVRTVGSRICRPGSMFFEMVDTTIVGFVEEVNEERIKIRIARTGLWFQTYNEISLSQDTIIWDDANNWEMCLVQY